MIVAHKEDRLIM